MTQFFADQPFAGLTAVVTGGASGIGFATTQVLARGGARLVVLDRDAGRLQATCHSLERAESVAWGRVCDISSEQDVSAAFDAIAAGGGLDILVNSAGIIGHVGPLEDCSADDFDRITAINVKGTFLCCRAAVAIMERAGRGSIVNVASTAGLVGSRRLGAYAMSKAAVASMTRSLALSTAGKGIRVNAVCPGSIDGDMLESTFTDQDREAQRQTMAALHPLGRLGTAEEVAMAIAFLASSAAGYITGVALPVDGGRLA
ncbi:SDR family oxidoreductase [Microvirga sp. BT688]|uniref:SDR family NAD(P)-dependent oxidoreductase n=1 Tax=Microvirga sp. TaxID=1873136 RepID=UPI0016894638|nr:SDR family NAD(P)-dependent oxidoreductase [Microvirga sp.]MBD2749351.1 SDR family oxidoreductase [Microvirga sp.]